MSTKQKSDFVFAQHGAKTYKIPMAEAARFEVPASETPFAPFQPNPAIKEAIASGNLGQGGEVGGRHHEWTEYHDQCGYGWYVWWQDGESYFGPHLHPIHGNPLAADEDDGVCGCA
jgi:hypothetical protein